jgi:hypothetical protein
MMPETREIRLALSEITTAAVTAQVVAAVREKLDENFDRKFDSMNAGVIEIGRDVAVLKKQMELIIGNGQPGALRELKAEVDANSTWILGQQGEQRATKRENKRQTALIATCLSVVLNVLIEGGKYLLTRSAH